MLPRHVRILVAPAAAKHPGGEGAMSWSDVHSDRPFNQFRELDAARESVFGILERVMGEGRDLADLLDVPESEIAPAVEANLRLRTSPVLQAIERYDDPFFRALSPATLAARERQRMNRRLLIVSPLFGLLSPSDLIPFYCLRPGARLDGVGTTTHFWKPRLAPVFDRAVRGRVVWNFLPRQLAPLAGLLDAGTSVVNVQFATATHAGLRPSVRDLRQLQGEFVRWLLVEDVTDPGAASAFRSRAGHVFAPASSPTSGSVTTLTFLRGAA